MADRNMTRNAYIFHAYCNGTPVAIIARDFDLSRSQAYRVISKICGSEGQHMASYVLIPAMNALFGSVWAKEGAN